jgi:hypothetical protein
MTSTKRLTVVGLAFCAMLVISAAPAHALFVNGQLGWTGTGVVTFSTGGGAPGTNFIDWCPVNTGTPVPGGVSGCPVVNNGLGDTAVTTATGTFVVPDPVGGPGTIVDITDDNTPPAPYTFVPVGATNIAGFFNFPDPWLYTVTSIDNQVCAPTPTLVCTGYFQLVQTGANVAVNFSGLGTINAGGDISNFTFLITGNFPGTTIAAVITAAASAAGAFSPSWSGTLTATGAPIPEPMTLLTLGTGSALLAYRRRRAAKKAAQTI